MSGVSYNLFALLERIGLLNSSKQKQHSSKQKQLANLGRFASWILELREWAFS